MTNADTAVQWFLDDAKRQGLSVREYEAKYRIILLPKQHDIASHEAALTDALGLKSGSVPLVDGESTVGELRAVLVLCEDIFVRTAGLAVIDYLDDNEVASEDTLDALLEAVAVARASAA